MKVILRLRPWRTDHIVFAVVATLIIAAFVFIMVAAGVDISR